MKRTKRMSLGQLRINCKDTVIRQNNAELGGSLRNQYENLISVRSDKQVIDDYIALQRCRAGCDGRETLVKREERCKEMYPHTKTDPQMYDPVCHCYSGAGSV